MLRVPDVEHLDVRRILGRKSVRTAKVVLGVFPLRLTAWFDVEDPVGVTRRDVARPILRKKLQLHATSRRRTRLRTRKADARVVRADTEAEEHAAENLALSGSMRQRISSRLTAISLYSFGIIGSGCAINTRSISPIARS